VDQELGIFQQELGIWWTLAGNQIWIPEAGYPARPHGCHWRLVNRAWHSLLREFRSCFVL
jgi:hypothetical protein